MGIIQRDALRTTIISYIGLALGYINKGFLFIVFLEVFEIGLINLIFAIGNLYAQLSNLGALNAVWRFFPIYRNAERKNYGFLLFTSLIALFGALVFGLIYYFGNHWIVNYYSKNSALFGDYSLWVLVYGLAVLAYKLFDSYLRALFRSVFSIFVNDVLTRLFVSVLIILYGYDFFSFSSFLASLCIVQWTPVVAQIIYLRFLGEWSMRWKNISIHRKAKRVIISYAAFGYLNTLSTTFALTIDAIMIGSMIGLEATGIYTTMVFISTALYVPIVAILRVAVPIVPNLYKERNIEELKKLYNNVSSVSISILLILILLVWINREELFSFLPAEFSSGMYVLLFLMLGKLFDGATGINGVILLSSKKFRYDLLFTSSSAMAVILLNLVLIPRFGITGAAISTALAYLLYNFVRVIFVFRVMKIHPFSWGQAKIVVLALLLFLGFELLPEMSDVHFLVRLIVKSSLIATIYFSVIYFLNLEKQTVGYMNKIRNKILRNKS